MLLRPRIVLLAALLCLSAGVIDNASTAARVSPGIRGQAAGTTLAAAQSVFDAADDFSATTNPNGPWSYGFISSGAFTLFDSQLQVTPGLDSWKHSVVQINGTPTVLFNGTTSSIAYITLNVNPGQLVFHPGASGEEAIVRFVAPQSGSASIDALFDTVDIHPGRTDVHIRQNGVELFSGSTPGAPACFSASIPLVAGDVVDFAVGWGTNLNYLNDSTSIEASIRYAGSGADSCAPPSHRKVIFIQGINSDADCTKPPDENGFTNRVKWIKDYITNVGGQSPLVAPLGLSDNDILYYSYRSPSVSRETCETSSNPGYNDDASCWSLDDMKGRDGQAEYLDEIVTDLVIADPGVTIDFIAHSQGAVLATYYASHYAVSAVRDNIGSIVTIDGAFGVDDLRSKLALDGQLLFGPLGRVCSQRVNLSYWGQLRRGLVVPVIETYGFDSMWDFNSDSAVLWAITDPGARSFDLYNLVADPGALCAPLDPDPVEPGVGRLSWAKNVLTLAAEHHASLWGDLDCGSALTVDSHDRALTFIGCALLRLQCDPGFIALLAPGIAAESAIDMSPNLLLDNLPASLDVTTTYPDGAPLAVPDDCLFSPSATLFCPSQPNAPVGSVKSAVASLASAYGTPVFSSGPGFTSWHVANPEPGVWTHRLMNTGAEPVTAEVVTSRQFALVADADADGISDSVDNCSTVANSGQVDSDNDGVGNQCDPDVDGDNALNGADNCVLAANADQLNTDAANPAANRPGADALGDACDDEIDGDGYTDDQETAAPLTEDPLTYCSIMRADVDGDGAVSILDITKVALYFTQSIPPAPERYSQDADAAISILDLTRMANVFTQPVSACA